MWRAGTAMEPSSWGPSTSMAVRRVSSLSDAVISSRPSLRTNRKFSRMGSGDLDGMALDTSIRAFRRLVLEMVRFISRTF